MKKLLFVLAIGAIATSCTDTTTDAESTTDTSAVVMPDTTMMVPDTTMMAPMDSTKVDSSVVK